MTIVHYQVLARGAPAVDSVEILLEFSDHAMRLHCNGGVELHASRTECPFHSLDVHMTIAATECTRDAHRQTLTNLQPFLMNDNGTKATYGIGRDCWSQSSGRRTTRSGRMAPELS